MGKKKLLLFVILSLTLVGGGLGFYFSSGEDFQGSFEVSSAQMGSDCSGNFKYSTALGSEGSLAFDKLVSFINTDKATPKTVCTYKFSAGDFSGLSDQFSDPSVYGAMNGCTTSEMSATDTTVSCLKTESGKQTKITITKEDDAFETAMTITVSGSSYSGSLAGYTDVVEVEIGK